jgi:hypothetical protein
VAYLPDLSPCDYFGFDPEGRLLAVGWLEPGQPYSEGKVDGPSPLHVTRQLEPRLLGPAAQDGPVFLGR